MEEKDHDGHHCPIDHTEQIKEVVADYQKGDSIVIYHNKSHRVPEGTPGGNSALFICSSGAHTAHMIQKLMQITGVGISAEIIDLDNPGKPGGDPDIDSIINKILKS